MLKDRVQYWFGGTAPVIKPQRLLQHKQLKVYLTNYITALYCKNNLQEKKTTTMTTKTTKQWRFPRGSNLKCHQLLMRSGGEHLVYLSISLRLLWGYGWPLSSLFSFSVVQKLPADRQSAMWNHTAARSWPRTVFSTMEQFKNVLRGSWLHINNACAISTQWFGLTEGLIPRCKSRSTLLCSSLEPLHAA